MVSVADRSRFLGREYEWNSKGTKKKMDAFFDIEGEKSPQSLGAKDCLEVECVDNCCPSADGWCPHGFIFK